MKISTDKASVETQTSTDDIIYEMNIFIANIKDILTKMTHDMNTRDIADEDNGAISINIKAIQDTIDAREKYIREHIPNDARFDDIVKRLGTLTDWTNMIELGFLSGGGGTRKRGRRRARKRTHRKPVQRKRKRTQRNAVQRKRKNNKRTRRRR